ncbi:MAG: response regulator transcription factor [bacterium]|nr:response regulator transcription factor [bacterium]
MAQIWCVEDDESIRDIELYTLRSMGFEARGLTDGGELRAALEEEIPDLILLDVMLPGDDGVTLLRELRAAARTETVPVIMATARGMEYDKIQSLDLGADDYLVKPFGMMEMVSRVKAVLRRCPDRGKQRSLRAGGLLMDQDEHSVRADGVRLQLTLKEYELLRGFLLHPGLAFTREQLMSQVWGADFVGESRTVDMHITTLRQKLGSYGKWIETVRGVGYRFEVKE